MPPERHRLGEGGDLDGVAAGGGLRDGGDGPANPLIVFDGDAEFFGAGLVLLVVVAALAAGVLDAPVGGQGVRGLVQQRAQDAGRVAGETFAADHDFGAVGACGVPALRGMVAVSALAAVTAGRDDDDHGRYLRMVAADRSPGVLENASSGRPIGMNPVLAHYRQPLSAGSHTFGLR